MADKDKTVQQVAVSGRDSKQVGGNNNETNRNLFVGVFFFIVLALGGVAWAFTAGVNQGGQAPQIDHQNEQKK